MSDSQQLSSRPRRKQFDFAPAAQGLWKALEREANLSTIQAARKARMVKMPQLFALFDKTLDPKKGRVNTGQSSQGRNIWKDINQAVNGKTEHRFLTLGDAWYVTKAMHGSSTELFDDVVERCIGTPLPSTVLSDWYNVILLTFTPF